MYMNENYYFDLENILVTVFINFLSTFYALDKSDISLLLYHSEKNINSVKISIYFGAPIRSHAASYILNQKTMLIPRVKRYD